jgi:transcription termination factor NusB
MNERIRELAEQALFESEFDDEQNIKITMDIFAELIVRECAGLCDQAVEENKRTFYTVNETREVGPALVAKGCQVQAEKLSKQIKEHFGVEE